MSEIFHYFTDIISYIMDNIIYIIIIILDSIFMVALCVFNLLYKLYTAAERVMDIYYWVSLFIFLFLFSWTFDRHTIIKKTLKIIYYILALIFFILVNMTTAGEDETYFLLKELELMDSPLYEQPSNRWVYEYIDLKVPKPSIYSSNVTYMMGDEIDRYYPYGEKAYLDLLIADSNLINSIFQSNIPELQNPNQILTKEELYLSFKDNVETNAMKSWYKLDKEKYTKQGVLEYSNFENLFKGIIASKATNPEVNVRWWDLCYLYGISHHKDIPFDLNDVKNHTPESLFNLLERKNADHTLNDYWKRMLTKYPNEKRAQFYTYMRIIAFVVSKNNR